jgi:hypothetical protein
MLADGCLSGPQLMGLTDSCLLCGGCGCNGLTAVVETWSTVGALDSSNVIWTLCWGGVRVLGSSRFVSLGLTVGSGVSS